MDAETFSAPVQLLTLRSDRRDFSTATSATYRAQIAPQVPIGLWIRQFIEERPEFLSQIVQQQSDFAGESARCLMILCGGGYDVLLLVNDTPWPLDINDVPKISLLLCLTTKILDNFSEEICQYGSIDPTDELWMHLTLGVRAGVFPGRFRIYLSAQFDGLAYREAPFEAKVNLRVQLETNNEISKVSRLDPQHAPAALYPLNREIDARKIRPDRKRAPKPSTSVPQKKKQKDSAKSNNVQPALVHKAPVAATAGVMKGSVGVKPNRRGDDKKAAPSTVKNTDADRPNLYGFRLNEYQTLKTAYEQSLIGDDARVQDRNLYGFRVEEYNILEKAYNTAMMQNDLPKPIKHSVKSPKRDGTPKVTPMDGTKGTISGAKRGTSSTPDIPVNKANGDINPPVRNLYGFSLDELKILEKAYTDSSAFTQEVAPPKVEAVSAKQSITAPPKTPIASKVATEGDQKRCFYFPFCTKSCDECGGTQRGRCREVKKGNVAIPDEQEFRKAKKKALRVVKKQKAIKMREG